MLSGDNEFVSREFFVAGRLCLFGEHSDWAAGYRSLNPDVTVGKTLIAGTNQGLYARAERHSSHLILRSTLENGEIVGPSEFPMVEKPLRAAAAAGGFFSYSAGVACHILLSHRVSGLVIDNYKTDLPIKKGLSSSAAVCVLTARIFSHLYDLQLTTRDEMEYAYLGEIMTPSRCGRMDQGCAIGSGPTLMTHDRETIAFESIRIGASIPMVLVDLGAEKNTTEILRRLNSCYPFARTLVERGVQDFLGPLNINLIERARAALEEGDGERLGSLMMEAQQLFDLYCTPVCPEQLAAPVLHKVLSHPMIQKYVWGGKGVGSQGDGSAQFVARSANDREGLMRVLDKELGLASLPFDLRPTA